MTGSQQSERRSQAIQAAERVLERMEESFAPGAAHRTASYWAKAIVDVVLAVPPAEPQEGNWIRPEDWTTEEDVERDTITQAKMQALRERSDAFLRRPRETFPEPPVQSSPDPVREAAEDFATKFGVWSKRVELQWGMVDQADMISAHKALVRALGSVREPGPNVTEEQIEKSAKAIYYAPAYASQPRKVPWHEDDFGHVEFDRNQYRIMACAALEAALPGDGTAR